MDQSGAALADAPPVSGWTAGGRWRRRQPRSLTSRVKQYRRASSSPLSADMSFEGVRPGGGVNPNPLAGGFTGMKGAKFTRFWILGRPEVWPLLGAVGIGAVLMTWGLAREFSSNPRYALAKSKRADHEVQFDGATQERFRATPIIPHPKNEFSLFPFTYKSLEQRTRAGPQ